MSKDLYQTKEYLFYYIAQFNIEKILKSIAWGFDVILEQNQREEYRKKFEKLNLEELFFNIPELEKNILTYIKDLRDLRYFYVEFYNLSRSLEKAQNSIDEATYSDSAPSELNKILLYIKLFWRFNNYNFLFIDHFAEAKDFYKNAINLILSSHSVKEEIIEDSIFGKPLERVRLKEIDYFIIFLIIKNFSSEEIINLFKKKELAEIKLSKKKDLDQKKSRELLFISFDNIINSLELDNSVIKQYFNYFCSFISIFSFIHLSNEEFNLIINKIQKLIETGSFGYLSYGNLFKAINIFIVKQTEKLNDVVDSEKIKGLLENIIQILLQSEYDIRLRTGLSLISNLSFLLNKKQTKKISDDLVKKLLEYEKIEIEHYKTIIVIYKASSEDSKEKIKKNLINTLSQEFNEKVYELACSNKIISPTVELEKKFVERLKEIINDPKNQRIFPSPIKSAYISATNYVANNDVIERQLFEAFKNKNNIFDLFFDPESIDFDNFDLMELIKLNPSSFSFFSNNPNLMNKIKKALENFITNNIDNKEIINIYFKYFVSK